MILLENWRLLIKNAWSVKFSVLAALLGGLEVMVQLWKPAGMPDGLFAGVAAMTSVAAGIARLLQQQEITGSKNGNDN